MFCDLYSLGRGEVSSRQGGCLFSLNNLQVVRGYRFSRVPKSVLEQACGSLGQWCEGGDLPMLEIVHHHEAPKAWPQIPARWRTPEIQGTGTASRMVPVTNPIELAMFSGDEEPYEPLGSPRIPEPQKVDVNELLPQLLQAIHMPDVGPRPEAVSSPELSPRPPGDRSIERVTTADLHAAVERMSGTCMGLTGSGAHCPRRARPGSSYCGAHGRVEARV